MADNRLLIRCRICGETVPIARVSAGELDWTPARGEAVDGWRQFLIDHGRCGIALPRAHLYVELTCENDHMVSLVALGNGGQVACLR